MLILGFLEKQMAEYSTRNNDIEEQKRHEASQEIASLRS